MRYKLRIPARINILGNPSDGLHGDFATISMAVNIYASAIVEAGNGIELALVENEASATNPARKLHFTPADIPLPYNNDLDLLKGAVNRLYTFSPEFREKVKKKGVSITLWTDVPRQSGMGGSSLLVLLVLTGLREYYELDPYAHNDYLISELTQRVESKELNIVCGYADRYVPLFGGLGYLDYRGKLFQKKIREEQFATYEKLDRWADNLSLVAISSGVPRQSGDVHGTMIVKYMAEHHAWEQDRGDIPPMLHFMRGAYETAWRGKMALVENNMKQFGALMNQNHKLVDEMMSYCGFTDGAGEYNNLLIKTALDNGALGAKLTGAGGGGSVFALVRPGAEEPLINALQQAANAAKLTEAQIYQPRVSPEGLVITTQD